jgi:hypothetical protein
MLMFQGCVVVGNLMLMSREDIVVGNLMLMFQRGRCGGTFNAHISERMLWWET